MNSNLHFYLFFDWCGLQKSKRKQFQQNGCSRCNNSYVLTRWKNHPFACTYMRSMDAANSRDALSRTPITRLSILYKVTFRRVKWEKFAEGITFGRLLYEYEFEFEGLLPRYNIKKTTKEHDPRKLQLSHLQKIIRFFVWRVMAILISLIYSFSNGWHMHHIPKLLQQQCL